jgi:hypothetical protein
LATLLRQVLGLATLPYTLATRGVTRDQMLATVMHQLALIIITFTKTSI